MKTSNALIIVFVIIIVAGTLMILHEVSSVKRFCNSINGSFNLNKGKYLCNNQPITKYADGWDFERINPFETKIILNLSK